MIFIINFFAISTENNGLERKNKIKNQLITINILDLLTYVMAKNLCLKYLAINYYSWFLFI